jgi:hypothetical protein
MRARLADAHAVAGRSSLLPIPCASAEGNVSLQISILQLKSPAEREVRQGF